MLPVSVSGPLRGGVGECGSWPASALQDASEVPTPAGLASGRVHAGNLDDKPRGWFPKSSVHRHQRAGSRAASTLDCLRMRVRVVGPGCVHRPEVILVVARDLFEEVYEFLDVPNFLGLQLGRAGR